MLPLEGNSGTIMPNESAVNSMATMAIRYAMAGMPCETAATEAMIENGAIGTMKIMPKTMRSLVVSVRLGWVLPCAAVCTAVPFPVLTDPAVFAAMMLLDPSSM